MRYCAVIVKLDVMIVQGLRFMMDPALMSRI